MLRKLCCAVSIIGLAGGAGALRAQAPAGVITTYAGGGTSSLDGVLATRYLLSAPSDVAADGLGNIYIADSGHHKVLKIDGATQRVSTVAGTGSAGYNGDNIPATSAQIQRPLGIAFDAAGNLYISDTGNDRIRRVNAVTGTITTYAGTGVPGFNADNIQATSAELNDPYHISFDRSGNLYIADSSNHRIRMVNTAGIITTIAGTGRGGYNGDNQPATSAELKDPQAALVDSNNNLYIADHDNDRVRLVSGGTITTYAGGGGTFGDGGPAASAKLKGPANIGMDLAGNLYIADENDNRVRRVNSATLIINTIAGNGRSGYSGDGGLAVNAAISRPYSAIFAQGHLYIASFGSDVVRVVNLTGPPATIIVLSGSPQTTQVGDSFPDRLTVMVRDSNGIGVGGAPVTFATPASGASATLSSSTATTDADGAAFVTADANLTAGSYSASATTPGVATPAAFSLTNAAGDAFEITFVQQPSNATAGAAISPAVTVRVRDLHGNPVSGAAITARIFASSKSLTGTTTQTTDTNGIATFADLTEDTAGSYSLQAATVSGLTAGSATFTVSPAAPNAVTVFSGSGQSTPALTPFPDALKATVTDAFGNTIPGVSVTFAAPAIGPSATFGGSATVTTGLGGIATSPVLTANSMAGAFNVTATAAGASIATFSLTNLRAVPKTLTFVQQPPSSTAAGSAMTPAIVALVQDAFLNALPGVQVTVQLEGPSQALNGTLSRSTDANGLATFNDLSIQQAGTNYQLDAVAISSSAEAFSNSFTITGAAPASISILSGGVQSATILTPYATPLTVTVADQFLNPVSGATVVFTAPTTGAGGLFSGSTTANVVTNAEGEAAAPITANGTAGAFTVTAGVGVFSASFQLTNTAGAPGRIVFTQQPPATVTAGATITPPVQVKLEDGSGNGVPAVAVTLTPSSQRRSAPVTATTDSGGLATFGTLTINTAGVYLLEAVAGAVSAQSNAVTVTAGPGTLMTAHSGSGQTSTVATLFHPLEAKVTDSFGNAVSGVSVTFTPPVSGPSVTGIPATVTTGSDGIATSPAITANTVAGAFQVTATGAGSATFNLTNVPGAGILKFTQQPSNATAGAAMPAIKVQIQDAFSNPVNTPNVTVTLQLSPMPTGATSPTANTDATGTATFNGFSVSVAGSYTLLALATGLESGSSAPFNVTAAAAANITALGGTPQSTGVGAPFAVPLVAQVTDSFTNPAPNTTVLFTVVPSGGAGGTFAGSPTASAISDPQGHASAPTLTANTKAGTFTVTATVGGQTAVWTLTNIAGLASQITFVTPPSTTVAGAAINPPVVVRVADSNGNPVGGETIVITAPVGPGALSGTQTAVADATGQAAFADLILTASGSYQLEASADGATQRSATFQVNAKTTNLTMQVLDGSSQTTPVGTTYASPLQVQVNDEFLNPVPGVTVLFAETFGSGAAVTFNGPTAVITDATGAATSATMTANAVVGLVTPSATAPGVAVPAAFALANVAGPAAGLVFVQQPVNTAAGASIAPPVTIQLRDAAGNPVLEPGVAVTLQLNPPATGLIQTQNTSLIGEATFSDFAVALAGTYQLQAQSQGLQSATSTSFVISPAAPSGIAVVSGNNQSAPVTTNYVVPLKVRVQDSLTNPVPGVVVTFTAPSSGASVTFLGPVAVTTDSSGEAAIFVTANSQVGSFQVTATAPGTATPAVFSLTNVSGSASHLSFVQQPSSAVAGAVIVPPVTVQLTDNVGNIVAQAGVAVTLTLSSAAIAGTTTVATNASGLASFTDLSIAKAGSYQLTAVGTSLVSAQSSAFTITAGPPSTITATGGTPQSTTVLAPFAVPLQALVSDAAGNPLSGVTVAFAAPATGASATLSAATATTDAAGHASVSAVANATAGSYAVTASVAGLTPTASFALANVGGSGVNLVFTQQPANTPAGTVMAPVAVRVTDSGGNPVSGVTIALTAQGGAGVLSGAAPVPTDASGLATFSTLSIDKTGTYTLHASDGTRVISSSSFVIGPGTSSSITVVAGNGQSAAVTTNYASQLKASVQDALGNGVPGVTVTFTAPSSGASVTFSGPAAVTTDSSGVAAISVTANTQVGAFQVTASVPGTAAAAVFSLTNVSGSASHLTFVQQPSSAGAGAVIAPPVTVQLTDSIGNSVAQSGVAVTLTLNPAAGREAAIAGTTTVVTDAGGLASFADLSIAKAGSYQLTALGTSLVTAESSTFTITAGPASTITATAGTPQSTTVLAPFAVPLQALVSDAAGNPLSGVTVSFAAPTTGASATLSAATATTDAAGHASVSAVANATAGSYAVTASVAGIATPASFALANVGGSGVNLVFTQQPVNTPAGTVMAPVAVRVTDSGGNPVSGVTIALTAQGGPGVLSGAAPEATDASGLATFSTLSIDKTGTYTLHASDGTRVISSSSFVIGPGTSSSITVVAGNGQSAAVTTNYASQLKASVQDALGNGVPGIAVTFAAPSSGASVTFSGPAAVTTDSSGVAAISVTANTQVGAFEVTASAPGTAAAAVFSLTNVSGSVSHLTFVQQPSSAVAGAVIAPPVTVQLTDSIGNSVAQADVAVTLTLNPAVGREAAIAGTTTVATNAAGLASFADLSIAKAGSYQLTALGVSLVTAESSAFTITAGPASTITATAGTPQSTTVLAPFAVPLQALVSDAAGNPLRGVTVSFAAPATGASATLSAASATTDSSGHASVSAVANATSGSYTVTASVTGVATPASFALANVGGTGVNLVFTEQPVNTPAGAVMAPVAVRVTDSGGNPVSGVTIALTAQGGPGVLSGAAPEATDASGLATFSTLSIDKTGTYTLHASDGTRVISSSSFVIGPGTSSSITVVTGNGQSAAVTTNYASQLKASVQDALGNGVPGVVVTFAAPSSGASVTFSGPAAVTTDSSGVAAISVTANTQVGSFEVTASAPGTAAAAVFSLTNVSGSASHLTFVEQPSSAGAGAVIAPPVTVQLTDSIGNSVAQAGVAVTLTLNPAAGREAAIAGTTTVVTDATGLASFADLSIAKAGSYQLTALGTSLVTAESSTFTITAGPASTITATAGTPQSTTVLAPFAVPLQALVSDAAGNPLSGVTVSFAAPTTGASATLSAATATTDAAGHASVSAVANATAGSYAVTASVAGIATPASFALANVGGSGVNLVFTQQPVNTPAGTVMAPVAVRVTDSGGNPVSGVTIALTAQGGPGVLSGAAPEATDASGLATFSTLSIDKTGTYTLHASDGTRVISSISFVIGPGTSSSITVVAGNGQSAAVTTNYASQLKASVQDTLGNGVPGVVVTFAAPSSGASVTFSGPAAVTTDSSGVAAISVTANTQVGAFEVTASAPGTAAAAVFSLTNVSGSASHLTFVQQPSSAVAGAVIAPPVTVQLTDSIGNSVAQADVAVTLTLNPAVGREAAIAGTTTVVTDAAGLASFADLSIAKAGSYQLTALGVSLVTAESSAFTITAGPASTITATAGTPQSTTVLAPFTVPLQALVSDAAGNPLRGVTVSFAAPATGASATLSAASATTDSSGHASVSAVANGVAGSFTVTASAAGLTPTASFALANVGGTGVNLVFTQQPVNTPAGTVMAPVAVRVTDSGGNPVSGVTIALTAQGGPGVLSGAAPEATDASGLATFSTLSIDKTGTYTLHASDGTRVISSISFVIGPGTSSSITVVAGNGQSAAVTTNYASQLKASVQDALGNGVPGIAVTFAAPSTGASVTFSGSPTVTTGIGGVAAISVTANTQVGDFQVTASAPGTAAAAVFSLTNVSGSASHLTFVQQPSSAGAGAVIAPPITVQLTDNVGNIVAQADVAVTLTLNPAVGREAAIAGTTTVVTDATGLASFADLSIAKAGSYQLTALGVSLVTAESSAFTITAGPASTITATAGTPQSTTVLAPFAAPLQALVSDAAGNPLSGVAVSFAAPATGASATLSAATATTDAAGHASVSATANSLAGAYAVTATVSGVTSAASFSLTNVARTASVLAFAQQPSNSTAGVTMNPVTVSLTDASGAAVSGTAVTLSLANSTVPLLGTLTHTTDASGHAVFNDLVLSTTGSYRMEAAAPPTSGESNPFQITPAAVSSIAAIAGGGLSAPTGAVYPAPLEAAVQDRFGNRVPGALVTFVAPPATGPSVIFAGSATVTTGSTGTATSPSMTANTQAGSFQVTATVPGAAAPATFPLTNTAGVPGRLTFVSQPTDTQAGATMVPAVTVQLLDSLGNPVHTAGVPVTLTPNPLAGIPPVFKGTATENTGSTGLATFADLSGAKVGAYQYTAQSGSLGPAESAAFRITTAAPASIRTTAGTPQSTAVLTPFTAPLVAIVTDSSGNPISGVSVVFTAPGTGASGTFGNASTSSITTGADGLASVSLTANGTPGSFVVSAATAAVAGSATFSLTNVAGSAHVLAFVQQPGVVASGQAISPPVTVQVRDSTGAPVNTAGIAISMTLASGTGTLSGSVASVTAANGLATFANLRIDLSGTKSLGAAAIGLTPAQSNSFIVTAGQASRIAAIGNTPQVTMPFQTFAAPLQALVTDSVGNPVSGALVTFSVPAIGPGGSFSGAPIVTTAANGVATSPVLTANGTAGGFAAIATTPTVPYVATFPLVILPPAGAVLTLDQQELTFVSEIAQLAPPQTVTVSAVSGAAVAWTALSSASWLAVSPNGGVTPGPVSVSVNPAGLSAGAYFGTVTFTPQTGDAVVLVVSYTVTPKPVLTVVPGSLIFQTLIQSDGTIPLPPAQTLSVGSSSRLISYQVSTAVESPRSATWLQISATQGQTPSAVQVSVTPAGLAPGVYSGSVSLQPTEAGIDPVYVPVTLVLGCNQGGCTAPPAEPPVMLAIVNSASFDVGGAPGASMTIFGRNLSATTTQALGYPLPTTLGTTVVTVNGAPVPLYYVSPGQIDFQMPSNTPIGTARVEVNAGGAQPSAGVQSVILTAVDPGLYLDGPRAAATNPDQTPHTAATPQPAGAVLAFYLTGQGAVTPAVPDGNAAPLDPLSLIDGTVQATIGGQPAEVTFAGLAPDHAGLAQVNVSIPQGLSPGDQLAFIVINGVPSNAGLISVR